MKKYILLLLIISSTQATALVESTTTLFWDYINTSVQETKKLNSDKTKLKSIITANIVCKANVEKDRITLNIYTKNLIRKIKKQTQLKAFYTMYFNALSIIDRRNTSCNNISIDRLGNIK